MCGDVTLQIVDMSDKTEWSCQVYNWLVDYQAENGVDIKRDHVESSGMRCNGVYAFDGEKLVGGTLFTLHKNWMFLDAVFILPEYRGKKIFTKIYNELNSICFDMKLSGIHLSTYTFESPHIYEHFGFVKGCVMPNVPPGNTSVDYYKVLNFL